MVGLSALVSAVESVIVRLGSAAPVSASLSRHGGALPSGRTGARRKSAPGSIRLASAPKSARGSAAASSPGMAIIPQRPAGRSSAVSTPLIFLSSMEV